MPTRLRLAASLTLPLAAVTEPVGIFANRGKGKSSLVRRFVEQLYRAGLPSVVLDIKGDWWGIRFAGTSEGLPFLIFGGERADVPLEEGSGPTIARFLAEHRVPAIIDLSGFSKTKARRWVMAFAEALYDANREPLMVVVDEADVLIPQRPSPEFLPLLGAMEDIAKRGRQRGLGITVASQRVQDVNKSVTELLETLFLGAITGPRMRKAILEWIDDHADSEESRGVIATLSTLDVGEFWIWSPSFLRLLERVRVDLFETFDSFRTPEPGQARRVPKTMAEVDVASLSAEITATIERAKADDPVELRARLRAAEAARDVREAMLASARQALVATGYFDAGQVDGDVAPRISELWAALGAREPETVEVPVLTEQAVEALRVVCAPLERQASAIVDAIDGIREAVHAAQELSAGAKEDQGSSRGSSAPQVRRPDTPAGTRSRTQSAPVPPPAGKTRPGAAEMRPPSPVGPDDDVRLSKPQHRLIDVLAAWEAIGVVPTRGQLAWKAGVSPRGSGFEKNLSTLRTAGLIAYPETGKVALTAAGHVRAAPPDRPMTEAEMQAAILGMVSRPQAEILRALHREHPSSLDREALAASVGVSAAGSGYEKNLSTLRSLGLVAYPAPGYVVLTDQFFLAGAA